MRNRSQIKQDNADFGAGGGNSLLLEVLLDIRAIVYKILKNQETDKLKADKLNKIEESLRAKFKE